MDAVSQRLRAHELVSVLPQDSLEIVVALMSKLIENDSSIIDQDCSVRSVSVDQNESLSKIRSLAGCFSACQSKDWKQEKAEILQEKYHP